jgi:hypothetical protein
VRVLVFGTMALFELIVLVDIASTEPISNCIISCDQLILGHKLNFCRFICMMTTCKVVISDTYNSYQELCCTLHIT